ncbi:MAG: TonB-dependent receptor [Nisaea sp.]|uniref:TonB-dependent receptor n=1 Tax=Nisaea sp. TaxID=2024842 RepID=UPI003299D17B
MTAAITITWLSLCATQPAWAQSISDGKSNAEESVEAVTLAPISVTARRVEEDLQEAPVSVTVIQSDEIGVSDVHTLEDVASRSANTLYNDQGGPLSIRGIGSLGISAGVDRQPAVGLFLDDVFIARPLGYPLYLEDIERVEVVRGSQSTIYGKNTIGGAVNLTTRDPGDVQSVTAEATVGGVRDLEGLSSRLGVSFDTPLSDVGAGSDLALRGYATWAGADGYIDNYDGGAVGDEDAAAARLALKGAVGDDTDLRVAFDYSRVRDDGGLWYAPVEKAYDYKVAQDFAPDHEQDIAGVSVRVDHDFGAFDLTSITAVRGHEYKAYLDGDFTSAALIGQAQEESQRQFSQELRVGSIQLGPAEWRGGAFYMHETFSGDQFFDYVTVPEDQWSRTTFDQDTDTYSVFGEVTVDLPSAFELIGGLRYTYETKDATAETSSPSGTFLFGAAGLASGTESFQNLSPELTLVYHANDRDLLFAKVSQGFKSGGISPFIDTDGSANEYDPEVNTSFELGAKTSWLDDRLTLNGSLFYTDWQDQQAVTYRTAFTRVITNAASATSKGAELEATAQLARGVTLRANYSYVDASYDDFADSVLGADYSGNPLPFAPEHSAGASIRWVGQVSQTLDGFATLDYSYRSTYSFNPDNAFRQGTTNLIGAQFGLQFDGWEAVLWGKNLLDDQYLKQYFSYSGTDMGVAAPGRAVGLTFRATW